MTKAQQTPDQARAALAELEARLDAGDDAVTAEQLVAARAAVEVAERHQQARERIEAAKIERERQDRIAAILDTRADWSTSAELAEAGERLVSAMTDFFEAAEPVARRRAATLEELYRLASGPGRNPFPDRLDLVSSGRAIVDGRTIDARSALQDLRAVVLEEINRREAEQAQGRREREFAERQRRQRVAAMHLVEQPEPVERTA